MFMLYYVSVSLSLLVWQFVVMCCVRQSVNQSVSQLVSFYESVSIYNVYLSTFLHVIQSVIQYLYFFSFSFLHFNEPISQFVNQSTSQSVNLCAIQLVTLSTLSYKSVSSSHSMSVYLLVHHSVSQLFPVSLKSTTNDNTRTHLPFTHR